MDKEPGGHKQAYLHAKMSIYYDFSLSVPIKYFGIILVLGVLSVFYVSSSFCVVSVLCILSGLHDLAGLCALSLLGIVL